MTVAIDVLHLDDHLVVVNKPSGMIVHRHRGWGEDPVVALTAARQAVGARLWSVHRLDRGTSGALAFARSPEVAHDLHMLFERGLVEKRYLAVVRGVAPDEGIIDSPVPRSETGPRVPAVTGYRRLHAFEGYSIVEARPRTGRFHQIRRHLKHIGHPLIGDTNYGKGEHNRHFRARYDLHRLALHALELGFVHPVTGAELRVRAPVPADLARLFAEVGAGGPAWPP